MRAQMHFKKLLEGFAYAGPLAVKLSNVLCQILHCTRYVTFAHTVITVYVVPALAVI